MVILRTVVARRPDSGKHTSNVFYWLRILGLTKEPYPEPNKPNKLNKPNEPYKPNKPYELNNISKLITWVVAQALAVLQVVQT